MNDTPEKLKFCKDCKYFTPHTEPSTDSFRYAKCAHPSVLDLVSGEIIRYCSVNRDTGECGTAAKLFEPKLP